jgi:septal ring factor EnvC (AmiA/AmiB activator)
MSKYIKVTEKDGPPFVVLATNKAFFMNLNAKIEEPTQEEIEAFFPEERPDFPGKTTRPNAELETVKKELEAEKAAHAETAKNLATVNAELETVKAALNEAQKQIAKLSKKE